MTATNKRPFFIVGAPRSGTTLLQTMLSCHPRLFVPPETEFFLRLTPSLKGHLTTDALNAYMDSSRWTDQGLDSHIFRRKAIGTDGSLRTAFFALLEMHTERSGKPRIGEKSPEHALHAETIHKHVPEAQFIHMTRDPRDVVASRKRTPWTQGSVYLLARHWEAFEAARHCNHSMLPEDQHLHIRYEDLVIQPRGTLQQVCHFLDENFDTEMLSFESRRDLGFSESEREWKGRTLQPLDPSRIGSYRDTLSSRETHVVQELLADPMIRLGYHHDHIPHRSSWVLMNAAGRAWDRIYRWHSRVRKRLRSR